MRTLLRDKKPLYICKKIPNSEPKQFEKPKPVSLNLVTSSSELDIVNFGEQHKNYRRATISIPEINEYNEGDRAYIYVEPPIVHDPLCEDCDFELVSIAAGVSQAKLLFKRLQIGTH